MSRQRIMKEKLCKEAFHQGHPNFKGPVLWGTQNNNLWRAEEYKRKGIEFVYIDMPYFDQTRPNVAIVGTEQYRVVWNATQHNKIVEVPGTRFKSLNIKIKDWRKPGKKVLVCPSSRGTTSFYGGGGWQSRIVGQAKVLGLKVEVREKRSSKWIMTEAPPLVSCLDDCYAVVVTASMAAVTAILNGVPVFCSEQSAAAPISLCDFRKMKKPAYSDRRLPWAKTLAYGQYTLEEISKGLPSINQFEYFRDIRFQDI